MKRGKILLFEKKQKNLFISSDSRRKGTKEDCYLQAPYIGDVTAPPVALTLR